MSCNCFGNRPPPAAAAMPLTLRNLTSMVIRITRTSRFPAPASSKGVPITAGNLTNVPNLANNLTSLLRRSPVSTVLPLKEPTARELAENATSFETQDVSIEIQPYTASDTGVDLGAAVVVLRLEFEVSGRRFRVDLVDRRELAPIALGDAGDIRLVAVFHRKRSHVAIVSSANLNNWMSRLRDDIGLGALSMPGTHNAPACYTALPSVRCQAVGITAQLENGVRFLDIRAQPDGPGGREMELVHANFPIALNGPKRLSGVMQECYDFLQRNPSECIVVSLKREGRAGTNDEEFSRLIKSEVVEKKRERWFIEPVIPTLGAARGRCILFRRYHIDNALKSEHDGRGYGINAETWTYNTPNDTIFSGNICVQDFSEVLETVNIPTKIGYVKEHLERSVNSITAAGRDGRQPPLFVNFLSASNFWRVGTWPDRVAAKINPAITEHLAIDHRVEGGNAGTGIVITDFMGEGGNWTMFRLVVGMNGGLLVQ